jgi:hypothetical protein
MTEVQNETWDTDGSKLLERHSLNVRLGHALNDNRELRSRMVAARVQLDTVIAKCRPESELQKGLRDVRMLLTDGWRKTDRERADEVVEEWLKDPDRNVFGLAADLLEAISIRGTV